MFIRFFLPVLSVLSVLPVAIALLATNCVAHEFWIEPNKYQVQSGAPLTGGLRNGQYFDGRDLAYFPKRFTRFDVIHNGQTTPLQGRLGDIPAIQMMAPQDGLLSIVHQTTPKSLKYAKWEKFAVFVAHKDFTNVKARHDSRGLPQSGFSETYTRYAKVLISVGNGAGADSQTGLETEFVALSNPYTDTSNSISVQLFYQGAPRTDTQIEVFEKNPEAQVEISYWRTDQFGKATIPTKKGHSYLFDAVVLRPAADDDPAVWETLWAALTFATPE